MLETYPVELNRTADFGLQIVWSDGRQQSMPIRWLRDQCPCAHCREKSMASRPTGLPILSAAELMPIEILGMQPVGNYGFHLQFSDGHASGIYTIEWFRELLPPISSA